MTRFAELRTRIARHRPRTLRSRLMLVAASAVAAAALSVSVGGYLVVRSQILVQLDTDLDRTWASLAREGAPRGPSWRDDRCLEDASSACAQVLTLADGGKAADPALLPVDDADREVAAGNRELAVRDVTIAGHPARMLTKPFGGRTALQVALRAEPEQRGLRDAQAMLVAAVLGSLLLAVGLGAWVAKLGLVPVVRLTETVEKLARTREPGHRDQAPPDTTGREDEVARLTRTFDAMLEDLERSVTARRSLVADASHELRTPLTAVRTNAELLAYGDVLDARQRDRIAAALNRQLRDLSDLVDDVVELARDEEPDPLLELVPMADLTDEVVATARAHWPNTPFTLTVEESARGLVLHGVPSRLAKMVSNLLNNAAKFGAPGMPVEVALSRTELTVRDHGDGIAPADLPHVFDRFYRADRARAVPGSGLGLAMVRQIARAHGAEVHADNAPGGGAVFRVRFPRP